METTRVDSVQTEVIENVSEHFDEDDEIQLITDYVISPCFELLNEMQSAMLDFIHEADANAVKNAKAYARFKKILGVE